MVVGASVVVIVVGSVVGTCVVGGASRNPAFLNCSSACYEENETTFKWMLHSCFKYLPLISVQVPTAFWRERLQ